MADQALAIVLVRLVVAVAVVIGLLLLTARLTRRVGAKGTTRGADAVRLVSRQPLTRNASIAVVQSGGRTLVLGVTDNMVTLLSERPIDGPDRPDATPLSLSSAQVSGNGTRNDSNTMRISDGDTLGAIARLRERTVRRT